MKTAGNGGPSVGSKPGTSATLPTNQQIPTQTSLAGPKIVTNKASR